MHAASAATRLVLCRHGEPDHDFRGRCCGRLDLVLSAHGRQQANALAVRLSELPLAAVYASPARRALQTAHPIASAHGLSPIEHPALQELDFGELEGLTYDEIATRHPQLYATWMREPSRVSFPGGESYRDLRARVLTAAAELSERHRGATFAAVTHAGPIRALLASSLAMVDEAIFRLDQQHGAISIVDWLEDTPIVRVVNADPVSCLPPLAAQAGR
jgi:broad specificity phosphatase PhoE